MRKQVYGRQFKRDSNERKALFKSLLSELVLHERVVTTTEKAKAVRGAADGLITKAKHNDRLHAMAMIQPLVTSNAASKLVNELGPRFTDRQGGYTRIIKLGRRFNDNAHIAYIEWTQKINPDSDKVIKTKSKRTSEVVAVNQEAPVRKKTDPAKNKKATKSSVKKKNKEDNL